MIKWKWWKKHTGEAPKEYEVANGDVEPVQETPMPEKDISEPVTSFIKCFEENPRRFKVEQPVLKELDCPVLSTYASRHKYKLIDKQTGESWKVFWQATTSTTIKWLIMNGSHKMKLTYSHSPL